jgi:hypothetical protein
MSKATVIRSAYSINIAVLADTSSSELSLNLQAPSSDVAAQRQPPELQPPSHKNPKKKVSYI